MKSKSVTYLAVAVGFLLIPGSMFAHHGTAAYDMTKLATIKGTVTDFEFINPHIEIYFDVRDDKGGVEKWTAEANSPNVLARRGWNRNTLKPGDQITAIGYRAKNGSNVMRLYKIVMPNSKELDLDRGGLDY
jgi:Family of unknown function (DUF6152)